jgi:BON domain-containing protein
MFKRKKDKGAALWLLAAGVLAGFATATLLGLRRRRRRAETPSGRLAELEDAVIRALRADPILRTRAIDVAAVAPGIVELTGSVETEEEAHHAVDVVQGVLVVSTVLNRLNLGEFERRLRKQRGAARAEASGSRWYGMGVGMGRRRQSRTTDPDRRDDRADMIDNALAPRSDDAVNDADDVNLKARELS